MKARLGGPYIVYIYIYYLYRSIYIAYVGPFSHPITRHGCMAFTYPYMD